MFIINIFADLFYLVSYILGLVENSTKSTIPKTFILIAIVLVSFLFYKGFEFAKWIICVLLIQPVLTCVFRVLKLFGIVGLFDGWLMLIITVSLSIIGGVLIGKSENISNFMEEQRRTRKWFNLTKF